MKQLVLPVVLLFTLWHGAARGQQTPWQWVSPVPQGNLLNAVCAMSPDSAVAVGEMGTIMRTTNAGATWQVAHSVAGIEDQFLAVSFSSTTDGWVVGEYGEILKSSDGGATWTLLPGPTVHDLFAVTFLSPTTGWIAGGGGVIFHTTDGGASWLAETTHTTAAIFGLCFKSASLGWAAGGYGTLLRTTDGGSTWALSPSGTTQALYSISFPTLSLGYAVGAFGTILRTLNAGATWAPAASPTDLTLYGVQFANAQTGWASGSYGVVVKTSDAGASWFVQSSPTFTDLYGMSFSPGSSTGFAIGDFGVMIRTVDGTTWRSISTGVKYDLYGMHFFSTQHAHAVGDLGAIAASSDGGETWSAQASGIFRPLFGVFFATDLLGWSVGDSATILKTTNGGATWVQTNSHTDLALYSVYFVNGTVGWSCGDFGAILASTNAGVSWFPETSHVSSALTRVKFATTSVGWVIGYGGTILKTTDGGAVWSPQSSGTFQTLTGLEVIDENRAFVSGDMGTIISTTNGGATWTPCQSNTDEGLTGITFLNSQMGWAAGDEGVVVMTSDGGASWAPQPQITDHALYEIQAMHASSGGAVYASGEGGTLISSGVSPLPLHVWTGAVDSSWYSGGNWSPVGAPTQLDSVYIPATAHNPVIRGTDQTVMIGGLTIAAGARLTVGAGPANMVIRSNVTLYGTFAFDPSSNTEVLVGGNFLSSFDGRFIPGGSTVVFTGPGLLRGTFYNMVLGPNALMATVGNVSIENQMDIFSNLSLRTIDTLTVYSPDPGAVEGPGLVTAGTIKRAIAPGALLPFRFESQSTYLRFYPGGTLPDTVTMTVYPGVLPPGLSDSVYARRYYAISGVGGSNFVAGMSLRFDTSESRLSVDNLSLFRDSSGIVLNAGRDDFLDSDYVALELDTVRTLSTWYFGRWDYFPRRPFEFTDSLVINDNGGHTDTLIYGAVEGATDGIDPDWGETLLSFPAPGPGTFDARWRVSPTQESKTDIRGLLDRTNPQRTYTFSAVPGPGGYPMKIAWRPVNLPLGTFFLRDQATHGGTFNYNMKLSDVLLLSTSSMSPLEIVHRIPAYYPYRAGWNLASLPLVPANDGRAATTFASAVSDAFGYNGAYFIEDTLRIGRAYWIKFSATQAVGFEGTPRGTDSIPVTAGWNMVGAGGKSILKSSVVQSPPAIVTSNYFRYAGGYSVTDTLLPSQGYWVKCSGPGMLIMQSAGATPAAASSSTIAAGSPGEQEGITALNSLVATDQAGNRQTLYFGAPPSPQFKADLFQMPPAPPEGAFDARFAPGSLVLVGAGRNLSGTISLRAATYPVQLRWAFRQQPAGRMTLRDARDGKVLFHSETGAADGSYTIADPGATSIRVTIEMNPLVPAQFSLKQNYPNPFNPATTIVFDLPEDALVTIQVYDLLGREIASLSDCERFSAGAHTVAFDGSKFSSGVYFYRCRAFAASGREFIESRKMLLLR